MTPHTTCWTLIEAAAAGFREERDRFAESYGPVVRAYLGARWRGSVLLQEIEDAAQDVFLECFKRGGLLEKAERGRPGGFRAFLHGAARHVALRFEERRAAAHARRADSEVKLEDLSAREPDVALEFDRAWAKAILREARRKQADLAAQAGAAAQKRVELLELRFQEGLPIRKIARLWQDDPDRLHEEYARAREEFHGALREVVAFHLPGSTPGEADRECRELIALLG